MNENYSENFYKNPDIVQEEKLKRISNLLKNVTLEVMSFEKIVDTAKKDDFIKYTQI